MDDLPQRLQRLEESHAFGEHTIDQLADEVRRAFAEIKALRRRLAVLEDQSRPPEPEAPDSPEGGDAPEAA